MFNDKQRNELLQSIMCDYENKKLKMCVETKKNDGPWEKRKLYS